MVAGGKFFGFSCNSSEAGMRVEGAMKDKIEKSVGRVLLLSARLHTARRAERLALISLFPGQELALQALSANGSMTMGELADSLDVKPPTVSKMIARLSAQSLVTRSGAGKDGRQVRVALTVDGEAKVKELGSQWQDIEDEMLAKLDGKERKQLRKLLRRVAKTLGKSVTTPEEDDADEEVVVGEP
jgi:MarR family transcriptional regulator, transcriptional regulator for hemolysin